VLRLQEELSDILGARVEIRANKKGTGKIQIQFGDLDQLDGILQRFRSPPESEDKGQQHEQ
jgi:ParB family chromosome partitioning protein